MTPSILDSDLALTHMHDWVPTVDHADVPSDIAVIRDNAFDSERIDGIYRGSETGIRLLAVTSRRLMMVESTSWEGQIALTSVPFARVTSVGLLASADGSLATSTVVGIRVQSAHYELNCDNAEVAREAHDLIAWTLVAG
jgi:hypothetical protein